jgi:hypothetical protein
MKNYIQNIIWNFAEWCLNTPLLEMASERNQLILKIQSKTRTINEHLFKCYIMPNSKDLNHWISEIDSRFDEILDLKWNKIKRFRKDEYFKMLYDSFFLKDDLSIDYKNLTRIISKIEDKYINEEKSDYTIDNFILKTGKILKDISKLLSNGEYDKDELINIIKTNYYV